MAIMSQRAYAQYRGVRHSAVQKAIGSHRISTLENGQIDSDTADQQWAQNTRQQVPPAFRSGEQVDGDEVFRQYGKARAVRMHFEARLAKLGYEERIGTLIPADEVRIVAFNLYRRYRDRMLNIPDRVAATLPEFTQSCRRK